MRIREINGTFKRLRLPWTPEQWNEGYFDNRKRFRVYRPDYPRAYAGGYALRYHVVWWLKTGSIHPEGFEIHHKDLSKSNDVFDNLELLSNSEHQKKHKSVQCKCDTCGTNFYRAKQQIRYKKSFCSPKCYWQSPKSALTCTRVSESLKRSYLEGRR
jgi:hypothetical protein